MTGCQTETPTHRRWRSNHQLSGGLDARINQNCLLLGENVEATRNPLCTYPAHTSNSNGCPRKNNCEFCPSTRMCEDLKGFTNTEKMERDTETIESVTDATSSEPVTRDVRRRLRLAAQVTVMPGKRSYPRWVREAKWPPKRATRDKSSLNMFINQSTSVPLFSHNTLASSGFFAPPFKVSEVNKSAASLMPFSL